MGLLDRFRGGKAEVAVDVDPTTVRAGGMLTATLRVTGGKKDMELDEGYVELVYENRYTYRSRDSDMFDDDNTSQIRERTTTDRVAYDRRRFLGPGRVDAGSSAEHTVELRVPEDAPASANGQITEVRWKAHAGLGRSGFDVEAEAPVRVLSPPEAHAVWAERAPAVDSHGDCELGFRLEQRSFGPADTIAGALTVRPLQECEIGELRVELVRREEVPRDAGHEEEAIEERVVVASDLAFPPGGAREFPFRVSVPGEPVPCLRTEQSTVRWLLRGVGSRRMRSDYNVTQELNVHSVAAGERPSS
jgi:hypothetical protein